MIIGYILSDYIEYGIQVPLNIILPKKQSNILDSDATGQTIPNTFSIKCVCLKILYIFRYV